METRNLVLEETNKKIVEDALRDAAQDFTLFFENLFVDNVEWTIAGHGPVAGTYYSMSELFEKAESPLYQRFAKPLTVTYKGVWADGDKVFTWIESKSEAVDGEPYRNCYMYILNMKDGKVVSGIEWLDLNAYYDIVNRIAL